MSPGRDDLGRSVCTAYMSPGSDDLGKSVCTVCMSLGRDVKDPLRM